MSTLAPEEAFAQEADQGSPVSARGKGIAGGALLGAEVVMIPMAIAGVDTWWPYLVFGAVGAGGGAVGGDIVEQVAEGEGNTGPSEPSLYMLAGGLALVIPTVVAVLNATAYDPSEELEDDEEIEDLPPEEETGKAAPLPTALLDISLHPHGKRRQPTFRMGLPNVQIGPLYSQAEMTQYGVSQGTQVGFPLVQGHF